MSTLRNLKAGHTQGIRLYIHTKERSCRADSSLLIPASSGNYLQREILLLVAVGILHGGLQLSQTGDVSQSGLLDRSVELLYRRLRSLGSGTLLGLLGTVLGMVGVFQTIAVNQALDPAALASGIWQALLTTVMSLVIAIPVLMVYYCLLLRIKGFRIEAVEHSYRALELVQGGRPTLEKEAKAQAETPREAGVRYV